MSAAHGIVRINMTAETPIASHAAVVDGLTLHYLEAGRGPTVILLHGYAETSRMWRPLMPQLAGQYRVIAPDLPGIGDSGIPSDGLDMKTSATRIHALMRQLGVEHAVVVGHDIGLMVAYAYAAQFQSEVDKLVLMDAFLPGVEGWEAIYNHPAIWHFRFNGATPEALVKGRERTYFEHFWNEFAADRTRSIPDFAHLSRTKLTMPVLTIGGDKANGAARAAQARIVATNAMSVVLVNTGHWVMEESPRETTEALTKFLRG